MTDSAGVPQTTSDPRIVLITDGEQRAALALVRSLARAGWTAHVCSLSGRSLAGASRFCASDTAAPNALTEPDAYAAAVKNVVTRTRASAMIPVSEASLLVLLAAKKSFPNVLIPFPPLEVFQRICDKALVLREANTIGIAVPQQHQLESPMAALPTSLRFPVVLKPSRSVGQRDSRRVKVGVTYARNDAELHYALRRLDAAAFPILLQERIAGPGAGIFLLRWNGHFIAQFSHRRIREKPPSGGVSVYRESVAADPGLIELSRRLLERLDWEGVAMVEYKVDQISGTPYLMEINGRFWGSLQLAVDSGVDFPVLLLDAARGAQPSPVTDYRLGVRSRWWWGDVDQLLSRLLHSAQSLQLGPNEPSRARSLLQFLILWRPGDRNEILRISDIGPFFHETTAWLRALWASRSKPTAAR